MKQSMQVLTSQETGEWYTDPESIRRVAATLRGIELDPASSELANTIVGAQRFFTKEDNGLEKVWNARTVFCNPPYTPRTSTIRWTGWMRQNYLDQNFASGILLVFAKIGYNWFNELVQNYPVCIAYERIPFISPATMTPLMDDNGRPLAAKHASAYVYFGRDIHAFKANFEDIGIMVMP